jgi:hypothetical protein
MTEKSRCYGDKFVADDFYKLVSTISVETVCGMMIAKINSLTAQYNTLVDELLHIKSNAPFLTVSLPMPDDVERPNSVKSSIMLLINKYNKLVAKYNRLVDEVIHAKQTMDVLLLSQPENDTVVAEKQVAEPMPVYITEETYIVQEAYIVEETYTVP